MMYGPKLSFHLFPTSRSKDIVEPLLKPQWYVDCNDMARQAVEVVEDGRLKITPDAHIKTWNTWLKNIR